MVPDREGEQGFEGAGLALFGKGLHGNGRRKQEKGPPCEAEKGPHARLVADEKDLEEEIADADQQDRDNEKGYGGVEVAPQLLFENTKDSMHCDYPFVSLVKMSSRRAPSLRSSRSFHPLATARSKIRSRGSVPGSQLSAYPGIPFSPS